MNNKIYWFRQNLNNTLPQLRLSEQISNSPGEKDANMGQLTIVIPLYNEKEVFPLLVERLNSTIQHLECSVEVLFIEDGSTDGTRQLVELKVKDDKRYSAIFLSRNHGHQLALTAGLKAVKNGVRCVCFGRRFARPTRTN